MIPILSARYMCLQFINYFNLTVPYSFIIGIIISFISVILNFITVKLNKDIKKYLKKKINIIKFKKINKNLKYKKYLLDTKYNKIFNFSFNVWLIIINIILCLSMMLNYSSLITEPIMYLYNINENETDFIIGCGAIGNIFISPICGILMTHMKFFVKS